ncbi:SAM-dependent methyltransferase [Rhizosphaericola mali]|uniref:SAM-dependent methyltransferase n=1 Tax=Rhizosphaericola mali TaxID=2545455 RepID=A0A5P2FW27_9BACT|nr:SAM-dependent methyltransferase [Rhizosphaericola mali]QES87724.1 SAM-dependent methyltransferase [Rhizosphaericola mali]
MLGKVYLVPTVLQDDDNALASLPSNVIDFVKDSQVIFAENIRTARRHLKKMDKDIVIDNFQWFEIGKAEEDVLNQFEKTLKAEKNISIISEAGCPGIADPGQFLVAKAQQLNAYIHPLVGPSSILLALMASGMNGQHFQFWGYLPVDNSDRRQKIKELENDATKRNCAQLFIETPYRNKPLVEEILKTCQPNSRLCVAVNITAENEKIITKSIKDWKKEKLDYLHKQPAIFIIDAGDGYKPKKH